MEIPLPQDRVIDGGSFLPLLKGDAITRARTRGVQSALAVSEDVEDAWRLLQICERHPEVGYRLVCKVASAFYEQSLRVNQMLLDNVSWGLE